MTVKHDIEAVLAIIAVVCGLVGVILTPRPRQGNPCFWASAGVVVLGVLGLLLILL